MVGWSFLGCPGRGHRTPARLHAQGCGLHQCNKRYSCEAWVGCCPGGMPAGSPGVRCFPRGVSGFWGVPVRPGRGGSCEFTPHCLRAAYPPSRHWTCMDRVWGISVPPISGTVCVWRAPVFCVGFSGRCATSSTLPWCSRWALQVRMQSPPCCINTILFCNV
jgi:hypothetical protein